ncbi:hypothetical protein IRZ71_10005 [Flavobacterium sp. ANB]|uniref:hypothetical protein n=1 Tax=unclassified Flavobacterium TaxID=196869 RepID=UPI0012B90FEB|nr:MULTISPECIES: hypothetical protein [unclassified Flavobacterium]MBF4516680.1 hypothetical protein [Flavobacterium sp. ANB]MTD69424.1 hypothetical protein [Flavobacterium sp. LC2016-13]
MWIRTKIIFKIRIIGVLLITFISTTCSKKDTINHFLTKPITQEELEKNGFYKYSYTVILDDEDKVDDTIRCLIKYDMYSNVKPEKMENGKICPTQLWNFYSEDSIKKRKNTDYLKNELNNRIITYLFRNDSLFYKDISIEFFDKTQNKMPDLTSRKKIINYYNGIKVSIEPLIKDAKEGEKYATQFLIDNYKTRFFYSDTKSDYEIFTNYLMSSTSYPIKEDWYSGYIYEVYYFD